MRKAVVVEVTREAIQRSHTAGGKLSLKTVASLPRALVSETNTYWYKLFLVREIAVVRPRQKDRDGGGSEWNEFVVDSIFSNWLRYMGLVNFPDKRQSEGYDFPGPQALHDA